jgi:hypothetical protein
MFGESGGGKRKNKNPAVRFGQGLEKQAAENEKTRIPL